MEKVNEILKDKNFTFKKQFGQNFITDTNLLKAIVQDAKITKDDEVLEIGVGAGTLTSVISEYAKKVIGYEIDKSLKEVYDVTLKQKDNIEIVFNDIMKADNCEIAEKFTKSFKIVANLPYYITTPVIFKFLENDFNLESLTVMVQKEVGERIVAKSGSKDYGILSIMIDSVAETKITRIVNRNMFTPPPNVDSCVVNMIFNKNKYQIQDYKLFRKIVNASFSMRRKTLVNNLKSNFKLTNEDIEKIFNECNFDLKVRGEMLSTQDYVLLTDKLSKIKGIL